MKTSFDYDGTITTKKGKETAKATTGEKYIISARNDREGMLETAKELNIWPSRVYATGSNDAKIKKIYELGIDKHYDNNPDVVNKLGKIGKLI